jgi:hypothetical protein
LANARFHVLTPSKKRRKRECALFFHTCRELNSGQGISIGLVCNHTTGILNIAAWQNTLNLLHAMPLPAAAAVATASVPLGNSSEVQTERGSERPAAAAAGRASAGAAAAAAGGGGGGGVGTISDAPVVEVLLRIDVELVLCQVWFSLNNGESWSALPPIGGGSHGSEMTFEYASTLMSWQAVGPVRKTKKGEKSEPVTVSPTVSGLHTRPRNAATPARPPLAAAAGRRRGCCV